jgi:dipeptidyl aminopeptidase/acylaminoacyl peptidase
VSPDGRFLAYVTRTEHRDELRLRDLQTGADRLLVALLDPDQLQSSAWQDLAARYAFTPDGRAILLSRANQIERIDIADGRVTPAPFEAHMQVDVGPSTRQHIREETGPVRARLAQHAIASPDGKRIAFSAIGDLYVQPVRGGPARRLSPGFQPSWSPDGRRLVYVTWTEADAGAVWTIAADGSGAPMRISDIAAFYTYPVFTPDGTQVLAQRSPAAARQHIIFEVGKRRPGQIVAFPAAGGAARVAGEGVFGGRPQFVAGDPGAVFIGADDGLDRLDLATGARSLVAQVQGPGYYFVEGDVAVDDLQISPDGRWLIAQVAQQAYLLPLPAKGSTVDVMTAGVARRLTDVGADFLRWAPHGRIDLVTGSRFQRLPAPAAIASAPPGAIKPQLTVQLMAEVPRDRPHGDLLIRHVRALTMANGDKVIADADILVHDDRFAAVGPSGSVTAPKGAKILDLSGKTVLPGFIDEHDHIGEIRRDVLSLDDWGLKARLAYGVTTSFDPSTLSIDMLAYQDLLDAGRMLGPRLRSTGQAVFSMNRFTCLDEVRAVLRRYRDDYRLSNIKEYRTGNRRVRQWMAIALKELGLQPTTEGALAMKLDVSQMLDGYAGHEHVLPDEPLGPDVIGLMTAMRTSYSTTLMVTNSGPPGADWFVAADDAQAIPKMRRFWPPWAIAQKLEDRPWRPLADYRFSAVAPGVQRLADAGGLVGMGAHGEVPGIGFHWEMQAHVMGGARPMTVLHAATAGSAETIGRLDDLGTIEPGKLADLVILNRDPLADIRNTQAIHAVMRGGRLYDGETLDELWPTARTLPKSSFERLDQSAAWLPAFPR